MDVDAASYTQVLSALLISISEADFVSLDLEFTGIPSRMPGKEPWKPRQGRKTTLEERYQETRTAAGRYPILQVGLTCARFDYVDNRYVLKPYNISLSPLLNENYKLDLEREIHIQSGAATFLLGHGFDLGAAFSQGVQYLSREEAHDAQRKVNARLDRKPDVEDMQLKPENTQSLDFVRRAREAIIAWKENKDDKDPLEITTHTGLPNPPSNPTISRFEKRLVHQLVRAEYPNLVTISRQECIRIIVYDQLREEVNKRNIKKRVQEQIAKHTGFRWIFEAIAADGDIHGAKAYYFDAHTKERFNRAEERLQKYQPVLVGHNMFTDLVYFYRSFVGELPDTLDSFRAALHDIFPRIVDTKYLATHAEGDLNASPTLQEIADKLESQPLPNIATHPSHDKYDDTAMFHEAGYDSLLTATILLRLSARLNADSQQSPDASNTSLNPTPDHPRTTSSPQAEVLAVGRRTKNSKAKSTSKSKPDRPLKTRFETRNAFAQLSLDPQPPSSPSDDDQGGVAVDFTDTAGDLTSTGMPAWQNEVFQPDMSNWFPIKQRKREPMEMIPAWDGEFWRSFGNTLRVYGTEEAVLKIADWEG